MEYLMDSLFKFFVLGLFIIVAVYGLGMTVVIVLGHQALGIKMVSGFSSMFAGLIGLGTGYLLGHRGRE